MSEMGETCNPGYTLNATDFMSRRTAESHATFFLPHLKAGTRSLDCGSGPSGMTVGLAERVRPGEVVGIDVGGAQLDVEDRNDSAAILRAWATEPDALFAQAWFGAIAHTT